MAFEKQILPQCPACNKYTFRVIESRKNNVSIRRRKQCDACGHRATTREVTEDFFQKAKENELIISKIRQFVLKTDVLDVDPVQTVPTTCMDCQHNKGDYCSYGFPEYDTDDAEDCLHFLKA